MQDTRKLVLDLRRLAMSQGFEPYALEVPLSAAVDLLGDRFAGMDVHYSDGPLTVLARGPGRVGKYQVVIPTRFTASLPLDPGLQGLPTSA